MPQMLSFTPRQISTPEVCLWTSREEYANLTTDINSCLHQIRNTQQDIPEVPSSSDGEEYPAYERTTQELLVDKKEELKPNLVDNGKSIVTGY